MDMRLSRHFKSARARLLALLVGALGLLAVADDQQGGEGGLPKPPVPDFTEQAACEILDVKAGNKLVVRLDGEETTVRLIGTYVPSKGSEADDALNFVTRLLTGESVYVQYEPDWPLRDRENRVWAYVYRAPDGLFVNLELIRLGYAKISAAGPFEHQELLRAYERLARKNDKGLWNPRTTLRTEALPPTQPAVQQTPEPAGTGESIIVYVTKHGRKYHRKDCRHVRGGALPLTLKEAKAQGYTPCKQCKPPE